ncbi:MAG: (Fe-S)-binding protein, partial [Bacteroidales bacterium]|nr:(Fe-S)-binding protein [Bacteroidales bacterium]
CYKIFKERYSLEGIRVVHHAEYLNELVKDGRLKVEHGEAVVAYHDPCELGRGSGIYDEPRELLSAVCTLSEGQKHHTESICCGGSIGSLTLSFAQREALTKNALNNLTVGNPAEIATACPLCMATFSRYADRPVRDLAEIIDAQVVI